jgi:hypothetical protein
MIFQTTLYSPERMEMAFTKVQTRGTPGRKQELQTTAITLSNSNVYALLKIKKILLAGTCGNGLYRSADNGITGRI